MITTVLDVVIAGLLLGGLYALIAMGLSLQYGVARVLNVSHGVLPRARQPKVGPGFGDHRALKLRRRAFFNASSEIA